MRWIITLIIIFSVLILASAQQDSNEKVNKEVYTALEKNAEVPVIITVNEDSGFIFKTDNIREVKDIVDKTGRQQGNLIVANVNKNEAKKLEESNAVEGVYYSHSFSAFLQDSARIINSTIVWPLQVSSINLTGVGESVCVIDTGINFTHPDLLGRNKTCVIDCFSKSCVENCSVSDDNGHGTHVAGIVAASSGIKGISPGAGLIGLKVLDSSGNGASGGQGEIDIMNAIQWCVTNKNNYNISVISMSLGTDTIYSGYCDSKFILTASINNATLYNISVIAASGNSGSITNISSPACIANATAVGWTNKDDTISTNSNRNSIVKLMAPGTNINSTFYGGACPTGFSCNGNYALVSGTSMAAPHAAGAIAVIREFLSLTGQTKTPKEIESVLNSTGKRISDASSGLNFSRINLYSAIISLDNLAPNVSLSSPANNAVNVSQNQTFRCNATDLALKNVTFYLWNSSSLWNSSFSAVSGSYAVFEINISNMPYDRYKWNCLFYDENSNSAKAVANFSLVIGGVSTTLISPSNNNHTNVNLTYFTCQSESDASHSLVNMTFYLWNSSSLVYNETKNISGILNSSVFNYTFLGEGRHNWTCGSWNNASNYSLAGNYSVIYDITKPIATLSEPFPADETSSSAAKVFYFNASDNYDFGFCSLIINNAASLTNSSVINSGNSSISQSFSPGTYSWSINCTDLAGNTGNSSSRSFTITAAPVQTFSSSGGGGGGSAVESKTYVLNKEQMSSGYTNTLGKNDKVKFIIFDEKNLEHELVVENVSENFVSLILKSEPIRIKLGIGQSVKLNLTSPDYYNLYIKLESIDNNKAKLTIQSIYDLIAREVIGSGDAVRDIESGEGRIIETGGIDMRYFYIGFIFLILAIITSGYILFRNFRKSFKAKFEINKKWKRN